MHLDSPASVGIDADDGSNIRFNRGDDADVEGEAPSSVWKLFER